MTDAFGEPLNYNKADPRAFGVLVTAPAMHAAAVERLRARLGWRGHKRAPAPRKAVEGVE